MCRIFLCSNPSKLKKPALIRLFENLDKQAGGHGVGIGYYDEAGEAVVHKGQNVTPAMAARIINKLDMPVMVHFRKASKGTEVKNFACHPFSTNEGLFCQNGSVKELCGTGAVSDTYIIQRLINNAGFENVSAVLENYGVFALLRPDGTFQWKKRGHGMHYRPFEDVYIPCKEYTDIAGNTQNTVYVGVSDWDCHRESWFIPKLEEEEFFEEEEPKVVVIVSTEAFEAYYGDDAPWDGDAGLLSVDRDTADELGGTPVSLFTQPTSESKENIKSLGLHVVDSDTNETIIAPVSIDAISTIN